MNIGVTAMPVASASAPQLSGLDEATLSAGNVVVHVAPDPKGGSGQIAAVIDIAAPPESVWRVMLDCGEAPKFIDGLESCEILQRDAGGQWDVRRHVVSWAWFLPSVTSVFRSDYVFARSIAFRMVKGDLDALEGQWMLIPQALGGTRVSYQARIAIALPVPDSWVQSALEEDVPKTLRALRQAVLSGKRP